MELTTAAARAARLRQDARHQAERNEAVVARDQIGWLAQTSTSHGLARFWAPEDIDVEEYMLGFVRDRRLLFVASIGRSRDVCRSVWHRFGGLRAQEAEGDERATHCAPLPDRAAKNHPPVQPEATCRTAHRHTLAAARHKPSAGLPRREI